MTPQKIKSVAISAARNVPASQIIKSVRVLIAADAPIVIMIKKPQRKKKRMTTRRKVNTGRPAGGSWGVLRG
jgi:hypothetical protein